MGRKKKNPELGHVGTIEVPNRTKSLIDNLKSNPKESQDDKNRKKWEKLIINTYNSKMQIDREHLYAKLMDKFSTEEEVKNILTEMKIKLKEFDYIIKKQWQVLKKFNLQENIYREESRSLFQTEKQRLNEILKLTIEKLTVCHISGFEPPSIIKNKILSKLQKKFNIEDSVLNQLRNIFIQVKFLQEEEQLTGKRYEDQMYVVEKILNSNTICIPSNMLGHDISRNVYFQAKQESKRYEKELELKSGKEIRPDLNNFDNFDVNNLSNNPNAPLGKKSSSTINFEKDIDMIHIKDNKSAIALTEDTTYFRQDDLINIDRFDSTTKMKDILGFNLIESIPDFKSKIIKTLTKKVESNNFNYEPITQHVYKSRILNDLNAKLVLFNKLSNFDIQILVQLTHSIVAELVDAKLNNRKYSGIICPEELIGFLRKYKIEIQKNTVSIDGRQISNLDMTQLHGNNSYHSYLHSQYSNFSEQSKEENNNY